MKKILITLIGLSLICFTCAEIQEPIDPNDPKGEITDSTHIPIDSADVPIDTIEIPVDTIDIPVDTIDVPIDTIDNPIDTIVVEPYENSDSIYHVVSTNEAPPVDGDWGKAEWADIKALELTHFQWEDPKFRPFVEVKMCYDPDFVYVIFRVEDKYVKALATQINGKVWEDAAVELFFAPDTTLPLVYFNLEINCIGTPLMYHIQKPMTEYVILEEEDIKTIEIASSLEGMILTEITDPVTWTLEYKIPLTMLEKYTRVHRPEAGVKWKANFFKIATNNSNNHFLTWSPVISEKPNFHMPQFFGSLVFH